MSTKEEFATARAQIEAKINKASADLEYWTEELKALNRAETTIQRLGIATGQPEELAFRQAPEDSGLSRLSISRHPLKKYGELTDRVEATVKSHAGEKVTATDVAREILKNGYQPSGKNFNVTVSQTLRRLATRYKWLKYGVKRDWEARENAWYRWVPKPPTEISVNVCADALTVHS